MMRAILVGLLGAVLMAGAAQAKSCPLDGLELVATGDEAFTGKTFRVTKVMSHFRRIKSPEVNDQENDGYVVALIEGDAGRFQITETYSGYGMPADYGFSEPATEESVKLIDTRKRAAEAEKVRVTGVFHVFAGPLDGVSLKPTNCR